MALSPLGTGWLPLIERALAALGGLGEAAPEVDAPARERLTRYLDEVVVWNQKTDLTAARTAEELVDLSLADACVIARAEVTEGAWVDVGSGAGAPGLVLAVLRSPAIALTLVEPKERRVAFLRSTIGKLGLARVVVHRGRSDGLTGAAFDVALSRATLPPSEWVREGARVARAAVWVLLAREDPPSAPGLRVGLDIAYSWPLTGAARRAVRYVRDGSEAVSTPSPKD